MASLLSERYRFPLYGASWTFSALAVLGNLTGTKPLSIIGAVGQELFLITSMAVFRFVTSNVYLRKQSRSAGLFSLRLYSSRDGAGLRIAQHSEIFARKIKHISVYEMCHISRNRLLCNCYL